MFARAAPDSQRMPSVMLGWLFGTLLRASLSSLHITLSPTGAIGVLDNFPIIEDLDHRFDLFVALLGSAVGAAFHFGKLLWDRVFVALTCHGLSRVHRVQDALFSITFHDDVAVTKFFADNSVAKAPHLRVTCAWLFMPNAVALASEVCTAF